MTVITCIVNNLIVDIIWHLLNKFTHDCYVLVRLYWHRNVLSIQPHLDTFPIPIPSKSTTPLSLRYNIRLRRHYLWFFPFCVRIKNVPQSKIRYYNWWITASSVEAIAHTSYLSYFLHIRIFWLTFSPHKSA